MPGRFEKSDIAILTKTYFEKIVIPLMKHETPGYALFKALGNVVDWPSSLKGTTGSYALRRTDNRGVLPSTTGRIPPSLKPIYKEATFTAKTVRAALAWDFDASHTASIERFVEKELQNLWRDVLNQMERKFNGWLYASSGIIGYLDASVAAAGTSIKVRRSSGATSNLHDKLGGLALRPNDFIMITDGTNAEYRKVSAVTHDYANDYSVVTIDAIVKSGGYSAGAKILWASPDAVSTASFAVSTDELSDYGNAFMGLGNIIADDPYNGVARDAEWKSITKANSGTGRAFDVSLIDELVMDMTNFTYQYPTDLLCSPGMWLEMATSMEDKFAFRNPQNPDVGHHPDAKPVFRTYEAAVGVGTMPIHVDPNCPGHVIYAYDKGSLGYAERRPFHMATEDGQEVRQLDANYDRWRKFARVVMNFISLHPGAVGAVYDVNQSKGLI